MSDTARAKTHPRAQHATKRSALRLGSLIRHPLSNYYLIAGSTVLLLGLGLIMVLSASSVESVRIHGSPYTLVQRQAMFAVLGLFGMFIASRSSVVFWKKLAYPALILSLVLLVAVLIIGVEVAGQRNWIEIFGPFRIQPSEFAKFGLVLWAAATLTQRSRDMRDWQSLLVPVVPVGASMVLLVLLENDFGNALMLAAILAGILFAAGAPLRLFAIMGGIGAIGVLLLTLIAPYRMARFSGWLNPGEDRLGVGWQLTQGQYALGSGGLWGLGLGASREKWGSLPEAHTDFIFPVIGEELGLVGTLTVLALFGLLAFAIFRLSRTTHDPFVRLVTAGVGAWVVAQSVINIGAVLGLLPITGVPLPLVSYGGSSLVPTLVAMGMLMAFSRNEPEARRALRRRSTATSLRRR